MSFWMGAIASDSKGVRGNILAELGKLFPDLKSSNVSTSDHSTLDFDTLTSIVNSMTVDSLSQMTYLTATIHVFFYFCFLLCFGFVVFVVFFNPHEYQMLNTLLIVKETLRMYSIAPLLLAEPYRDATISGYKVKKGTKISIISFHFFSFLFSHLSQSFHQNP